MEALIRLYEAGYPVGILIAPVILVPAGRTCTRRFFRRWPKTCPDEPLRSAPLELIFMTYSRTHESINAAAFPGRRHSVRENSASRRPGTATGPRSAGRRGIPAAESGGAAARVPDRLYLLTAVTPRAASAASIASSVSASPVSVSARGSRYSGFSTPAYPASYRSVHSMTRARAASSTGIPYIGVSRAVFAAGLLRRLRPRRARSSHCANRGLPSSISRAFIGHVHLAQQHVHMPGHTAGYRWIA